MHAGRCKSDLRGKREDTEGGSDLPQRAGFPKYAEAAERLIDNGYAPLPIIPGQKRPAPTRWSSLELTPRCIQNWTVRYPDHGIGLRTGHLVGLDIDELDPDLAHEIQHLAERRFGPTLVRVGQWPKRLLLYRTITPFAKMKTGQVELLGAGQQFVAFGLHSATARPYSWVTGETPLDVSFDDLPLLDAGRAAEFMTEISPGEVRYASRPNRKHRPTYPASDKPVRNDSGLVVDGRDAWLSRIAFHAVHDVLESDQEPGIDAIVDQVWQRFRDSADLDRPRQNGTKPYGRSDAFRKVRDKLRLARAGQLPGRDPDLPAPEFDVPSLSADEGRSRLNELLRGYCDQVRSWHHGESLEVPMLGIRATVGLGKSRASREHLMPLVSALRQENLPHRVLVFAASHALAEETATAWATTGAQVAVLRGYERTDPVTDDPMCRDLDAVRAALASGLQVRPSACAGSDGTSCRFFEGCLKQQNLRDVANADVVVAPYDALFSGLAFEKDDVALLLIDEGCWARATEQMSDLCVDDIRNEPIAGMGNGTGRGPVSAMADLLDFRGRVADALTVNRPGPVTRAALLEAGLCAGACHEAARLERRRMIDPDLHPGVIGERRLNAFRIATENARILRLASLWTALGHFLAGTRAQSGRLRIRQADSAGRHRIDLRHVRALHESLRGKPVLHLDATMRAELLRTVLPDLQIEAIHVAAPCMKVRQVQGSFGKSMLCPAPRLAEAEAARRANRLGECVDYVRWHARRVFPRRVLVVTYKVIEEAFGGISNVEVAHFNAVAGLDCYKDVGLLISIGRPLPPSAELEALAGAYLDHVPSGRYHRHRAGLWQRGGQLRGVSVIRHDDRVAEVVRAAICDDELIQVVGRGRGINRTPENPLEVHVLADVALPLVYERMTNWDIECPGLLQRMLLAGPAVDSPTDACVLHPDLFRNAHQAKKTFERAAFKGQNPIRTSYREMSLKSAAYRRTGRGRGWQRAWWIEGDAPDVRRRLEEQLGKFAEWHSD